MAVYILRFSHRLSLIVSIFVRVLWNGRSKNVCFLQAIPEVHSLLGERAQLKRETQNVIICKVWGLETKFLLNRGKNSFSSKWL